MRFMMLMIPNIPATDWTPMSAEPIIAMGKYNEELAKAGVLLTVDGLHPLEKGVRITFPEGKAIVHDGPFTEAKEVIGGYWIIEVKDQAEAIEWASRCPIGGEGPVLEVRQIFEFEDFPENVRAAVAASR